jgi:hypothetical protein
LDLQFCNALKLGPDGVHDLLGPSQRPSRGSHLLNDLLAVFLVAVGDVDAPGRHRVKGCVHGLARLIRKSDDDIELKSREFAELPCMARLLSVRIVVPRDRGEAFPGDFFERRDTDDLNFSWTSFLPNRALR